MPFGLKELGRNIKRLRLARMSRIKPGRPLLQRELAERAGIPASSLCNIENGKYRNPTWEILSKIAAALECEIPQFFSAEEIRIAPSQIALNEMIETLIRDRLDELLKERPGHRR
jgi:transcriptional regulator with XRE-family HTH domain